ncbi:MULTISPECIES: RNA polymerase sigma factor [unclassified Iodidimonas]|jgi:RNA polymerase sigma-70 factor (ECF subfamily)|uniref:RNA polymerase sigma factor n=1 Tax=unclassified Iodidimonas TaxID=2626145 RepID=UPI002482CC0E|nr:MULTISPECIES: RNA polymerase sigma factor [unclassified Iodidimonas]
MSRQRNAELDRLVRTGNARLVRSLVGKLNHHQDAQDTAQDAYVRYLRIQNPGPISNLAAFIGKSARNLAIDRLRTRKRKRQTEQPSFDGEIDDLAGPSCDDPERTLAARQQIDAISEAINALPPRCRQAFILHRFHGLSYDAIALELHVSKSSVEKYIIEALTACRKKIL